MRSKKRTPSAILVLLGTAGAVLGQPAQAWDDDHDRNVRGSPCERTADTMFKACLFDVGDNLYVTIASCKNIADRTERQACIAGARETRREEAGECQDVQEARENVCELLGERRYDPDPLTGVSPITGEPITFVDPDAIGASAPPNPFFSLVPGTTQVLRGGDESFPETIVIHVTDQTREIHPDPDDEASSVDCRVVVDIALEEGEAVEVTDDWYAQSTTGDVYYCGELARNYEDGVLRDIDGSFESGRDFAKAGLLISHDPGAPPFAHRQEFSLGEAEDTIRYVGTMESPTEEEGGENPNDAAFECQDQCVKTEEFIPTEPEAGEYKYFLPGVGFVLGIALEDGELTGEREELVCIGASLDDVVTETCGIENPAAVREELCRLAPDALCE